MSWFFRATSGLVQVTGAGPPAVDPLALVYPYETTAPNIVTVTSESTLEAEVDFGTPVGRHVKVAYNHTAATTITLSANGTAADPIVVRPDGALLSRTISNAAIDITGSYIVLVGFNLINTRVSLRGHHNRLTRCRTLIQNQSVAAGINGNDIRVDHNDISELTFGGGENRFGIVVNIDAFLTPTPLQPRRMLIDRNYLHDVENQGGENGHEAIQVGSNPGDNLHNTACRIEGNLVARWQSGEGEIMSIKAIGVTTLGNTVIDAPGERWGCRQAPAVLRSDWVENCNQVRLLGAAHPGATHANGMVAEPCVGPAAYGLRLVNTPFRVLAGNTTYAAKVNNDLQEIADPDNNYARSESALLVGITSNDTFDIGRQPITSGPGLADLAAINTRLEACVGTVDTSSPHLQTGTVVQSTTTHAFTPAVKLTTANVGVNANDPYHTENGGNGPNW